MEGEYERSTQAFDLSGALGRLFKTVITIVILSYIALTVLHISNGFGFGPSLEMSLRDIRMAASCPNKPKAVGGFINRSYGESQEAGLAMALGEDVYSATCEAGTFPPHYQY